MRIRLLHAAITCVATAMLCLSPTASAAPERIDELLRTALMLDARPKLGAVIYKDNCKGCHGQKAEGDATSGIPTLAAQRLAYLVKQFADFSELDRDSQIMHRVIVRKSLNEPQTWMDVAAYINSLPPVSSVQVGNGKKILFGEAIFREQCSSCHEEDARGDDDGFVPALRNQHYSYLLKEMLAFADGHRRNVDPDLELFLASIQDDEMEATADYLSRLRSRVRDRSKMRQNGVVSD